MYLVLQLITDYRYNPKSWRGLSEGHCYGDRYQDISTIVQSYVLNIVQCSNLCKNHWAVSKRFNQKKGAFGHTWAFGTLYTLLKFGRILMDLYHFYHPFLTPALLQHT